MVSRTICQVAHIYRRLFQKKQEDGSPKEEELLFRCTLFHEDIFSVLAKIEHSHSPSYPGFYKNLSF